VPHEQQADIAYIRSKDFDNTPEAINLSNNFASFESVIRALGIPRGRLTDYCQILLSLCKGRTRFICSSQTVGCRYFFGDGWKRLSEKERNRTTKQGTRLYTDLCKISDKLVIRDGVYLQLPLMNIILRASEVMRRGYSPKEAAGLILDEVPTPVERTRKSRHIVSRLKTIQTLLKGCFEEDSELTQSALAPLRLWDYGEHRDKTTHTQPENANSCLKSVVSSADVILAQFLQLPFSRTNRPLKPRRVTCSSVRSPSLVPQ